MGETLNWGRLDDRRASRVALYRPGTIDDDIKTLLEIREWMVSHLRKMREVCSPCLEVYFAK